MTCIDCGTNGTEPTGSVESNASPQRPQFAWKRGICILTFLCIGFLLQGIGYSHLNSFFDVYALENKDISSTEYGVIIGAYYVVMIIGEPIIAKILSLELFGERFLLFAAWIIDAVFCLSMSLVRKLQPGTPFFVGSLVIRVLEAVGCAIGFLMPSVIIELELKEISYIALPLLETIFGTAFIAGPALSGFLFDLGGFPLPFWVLGSTLLIWVILALFLFPEPRPQTPTEHPPKQIGLLEALEPTVIINLLCTISCFTALSCNESTLARQLDTKFQMSASQCSLLLIYAGVSYPISTLLCGLMSKRWVDPRHFMLVGLLFMVIALVLQGPLIPIEQTRGTVLLAQLILSIGAGPSFICSYLHSLRHLCRKEELQGVYGVLTALYSPAASVGAAAGPLFAGIIRQHYGYVAVVAVTTAQCSLVAVLLAASICAERCSSWKRRPEP